MQRMQPYILPRSLCYARTHSARSACLAEGARTPPSSEQQSRHARPWPQAQLFVTSPDLQCQPDLCRETALRVELAASGEPGATGCVSTVVALCRGSSACLVRLLHAATCAVLPMSQGLKPHTPILRRSTSR